MQGKVILGRILMIVLLASATACGVGNPNSGAQSAPPAANPAPAPSSSDEVAGNLVRAGGSLSVRDVADRVRPSVAQIVTEKGVSRSSSLGRGGTQRVS